MTGGKSEEHHWWKNWRCIKAADAFVAQESEFRGDPSPNPLKSYIVIRSGKLKFSTYSPDKLAYG